MPNFVVGPQPRSARDEQPMTAGWVALTVAMGLAAAPGQSLAPGFVSAGQLVALCGAEGATRETDRALCLGYVVGVIDQLLLQQAAYPSMGRTICPDKGTTADDLATAVAKRSTLRPSVSQVAAAGLVQSMLEDATSWAQELSPREPLQIVVQLPPAEAAKAEARVIGDAIRSYFAGRAKATSHELAELFRLGRRAAVIGALALAVCVVAGQIAARELGGGYVGRFFAEGLIILGWVANWRPIEIFLYDWWPLTRRRRLQQRLARAEVMVAPVGA